MLNENEGNISLYTTELRAYRMLYVLRRFAIVP